MNYIVFDLEATCWERSSPENSRPNEIIEIGAVLYNDQFLPVDEYVQFIKPIAYPKLSDFCTELTSIKQSNVDGAPIFSEVVEDFKNWCGQGDNDYILCSWGFYDKKQLKSDCERHGLEHNWTRKHISLKHQYGRMTSNGKPPGMKTALKMEGFSLDGTHHRGIDDARNIAKIFIKYRELWDFSKR